MARPLVLGASMGNPTHGKGHEEVVLAKTKADISPQGYSCIFLSIYPQNQSLPDLLYCAFHSSDITRSYL